MNKNLNILHLEDNYYDFEIISSILKEELSSDEFIYNIIHAKNKNEFINALNKEKIDLILSDYTIPGYSGFEALAFLRENYPDIPFIFVSGTIGEEKAIECLKNGARDYIIKDRIKRLVPSILNVIKEEEIKTEKKKLEDDFLRLQRIENIGALANGIAHDLNNVLAPIQMASEIFKLKLTDDKSQKLISIIQSSVTHATDLIRQILLFGRGNNDETININPNSIASDIIYMIKSTFPKSIIIIQDLAEDLWNITGNQTQINQVLLNLCINARDAMSNGGTLKITTANIIIDHENGKKGGEYVEISVSDTGEGMSPEVMEKIFDPFFTTKEKGTGTGLATSMSIAKRYGGFIKVSSDLGIGTEFKIYFPVSKSQNVSIISGVSPEIPSGKNELVLVVDDELSIREMMKTTLEVYNYRVLTAAEGIEAISIYSKNKDNIGVIFVDLRMPLMDGVDTITVLRKLNPKCKIIVFTGLTDGRNILGNPEEFSILQKPFAAEQMLITLHNVLKNN